MGLGEFHSRCLPRRLTFGPPMIWALFYFFHFYSPLFPSARLMERRRNKWRAVAQQGMEGWTCRGRGTGGRGLGYRAYLFSGMRQVRYPQLRLAHLFMLNATPWEARLCHRKYRNPFFSLSAAPSDCWICSFHLSDLSWDPRIRYSQQIIGFAFHLPLRIQLPNNSAHRYVCFLFCLIQLHVRPLFIFSHLVYKMRSR